MKTNFDNRVDDNIVGNPLEACVVSIDLNQAGFDACSFPGMLAFL